MDHLRPPSSPDLRPDGLLHLLIARRALLRRAAQVGLAAPALSALLAARPASAQSATTVNLWHSIPPETETFWQSSLLAPFSAAHPDINLVTRQLGIEDPAKIRAGLAAGGAQAPAMTWIASSETGAYVEGNVLADVDTWLTSKAQLKSDIVPALLDLSSYQGRVRSLPWMTNNIAMWVNVDAFSQAGVPIPSQDPEQTWTWDQFADACRKLTAGDQKGFLLPVNNPGWDAWVFHAWIAQAGGQFMTEEGDPKFADPPALEAVTFLKSLAASGLTAFAEPNNAADAGAWYAGKVAILANGPWNFPTLSTFDKFNFTVVPYPRYKRPATNLGGDQLFMFEQGPAIDAASFAYAEYMLSPEFQVAFSIQSGNLPVVKSAVNSTQYQDHLSRYPFIAGWTNQTAYGVMRQPVPQYADVATIFGEAWGDIVLNDANPANRLQQAAQQAAALKRA